MLHKDLADPIDGESSAVIRERVEKARAIQRERLAPFGLHSNSAMASRHIRKFCPVDEQGQKLLEMVTDKLGLSARSYSRILKVARTIADLAESADITVQHLSEAIQYRGLDRKLPPSDYWQITKYKPFRKCISEGHKSLDKAGGDKIPSVNIFLWRWSSPKPLAKADDSCS